MPDKYIIPDSLGLVLSDEQRRQAEATGTIAIELRAPTPLPDEALGAECGATITEAGGRRSRCARRKGNHWLDGWSGERVHVSADNLTWPESLSDFAPVIDARTASAEELNKALAERGWRLAFDTEPAKPKVNIGTYIAIMPDGGAATLPALVSGTWNDSGEHGVQTITVGGRRQTGKTERLIDAMIKHAQAGERVVFFAKTFALAMNAFDRIERRGVAGKFYYAHGSERICFPSGGEIRFLANSARSGAGLSADVIVLDEVTPTPERWQALLPMLCASKSPRIYKSVLTDEGTGEER